MSAPPYATSLDPAGAAILVFTIAFTLAGIIFVPPLVRPSSSRRIRGLAVACLACSAVLCAFLAFYGAFTGMAVNGRVENGHYFVGDHGYFTEVSPAIYTLSRILGISTLLSFPVLCICASWLFSAKRNSSSKDDQARLGR